MGNFVKALHKKGTHFQYLKNIFRNLSEAELERKLWALPP